MRLSIAVVGAGLAAMITAISPGKRDTVPSAEVLPTETNNDAVLLVFPLEGNVAAVELTPLRAETPVPALQLATETKTAGFELLASVPVAVPASASSRRMFEPDPFTEFSLECTVKRDKPVSVPVLK
jgi:hypothetical protein